MSKAITILAILSMVNMSCSVKTDAQATNQNTEFFNTDWAKKQLWNDGKAEVARYRATRDVYGKSRSFEYVYVLVKEVFNKEYNVKTDDYSRKDLFEVMKINKFCRIETAAYPYHYLTSVFISRDNSVLLHKLTNTSQEWCGNTAKSFTNTGEDFQYEFISYWDGEGNGEVSISNAPLFEDQLSYTLRSLRFAEGLAMKIALYPSEVNSRAKVPQAVSTQISVAKSTKKELEDIDSTLIVNPWKVTVSSSLGESNYWFNGEYPNYMLKMTGSGGRSLELESVERDDYWAKE
jgi:hypothetical protein